MYYKQLTESERHFIDISYNIEKRNKSEIAKLLRRSKSTISREIKRNSTNQIYFYENAEKKKIDRSYNKYKFRKLKYQEFSKLFLKYYDKRVHGVKATWHKIKTKYPEIDSISWVWIFKLIKTNKWVITRKDRLRQYYKKGGKRSVGIFTKVNNKYVRPFWTRPKHIDLREEDGHWEVDLIIGKKANGYANILTFNNRKNDLYFVRKIWSKNPMKVNSSIYKLIREEKLDVKTITVDNGLEFEKIGLLGKWVNCIIYRCEPYASYQRGSNENLNGMFRRFYKKGTDFSPIDEVETQEVQNK